MLVSKNPFGFFNFGMDSKEDNRRVPNHNYNNGPADRNDDRIYE